MVILWLLGTAGCGLLGWSVLSTRRMLYPKARALTIPHPFPSVNTTQLISRDGASFDIHLLEARPTRGVIVACHGYHANWLQLIEIGRGLCQRGYSMITFNLRGHGTRPGPCTFGIRESGDLDALLTWTQQQPALARHPVGMLGLSLGGAIVCQAAARHPTVGAIVLDSTYARLFPVVAGVIRRTYHFPKIPWAWLTWAGVQVALHRRLSSVDPQVVATRCRQPLLAIHGTADHTVPVEHARKLVASWRGPTEQWLEPGAGHVGIYTAHPADYCHRVADFFDRWLLLSSPC